MLKTNFYYYFCKKILKNYIKIEKYNFLPTWLLILNRFWVCISIRILCYYIHLYVLTVMRNDSPHRSWSTKDRCKSYGVHYPGRTWPIARTRAWPNRVAPAYNAYRSSTSTSACAANTATRLTTAVAAAAINRFRSTVHRSYTTPATKYKKGKCASLPYTTPSLHTKPPFSARCVVIFLSISRKLLACLTLEQNWFSEKFPIIQIWLNLRSGVEQTDIWTEWHTDN